MVTGSRSGLVQKHITDKNGHARRVWVRPVERAAADGRAGASIAPTAIAPKTTRDFAIEMLDVSPEVFDEHFTPEKIRDHAGHIYEYMVEHGTDQDSVSREALFEYAAERLNIDYEVLYSRWLTGS